MYLLICSQECTGKVSHHAIGEGPFFLNPGSSLLPSSNPNRKDLGRTDQEGGPILLRPNHPLADKRLINGKWDQLRGPLLWPGYKVVVTNLWMYCLKLAILKQFNAMSKVASGLEGCPYFENTINSKTKLCCGLFNFACGFTLK